jgi:RNA polymerase sigma factor (sigma-70 family)
MGGQANDSRLDGTLPYRQIVGAGAPMQAFSGISDQDSEWNDVIAKLRLLLESDSLSDTARRVVRLYWFDGWSVEEIARETGLDKVKVRQILSRAKRRLAQAW